MEDWRSPLLALCSAATPVFYWVLAFVSSGNVPSEAPKHLRPKQMSCDKLSALQIVRPGRCPVLELFARVFPLFFFTIISVASIHRFIASSSSRTESSSLSAVAAFEKLICGHHTPRCTPLTVRNRFGAEGPIGPRAHRLSDGQAVRIALVRESHRAEVHKTKPTKGRHKGIHKSRKK